MRLSARMIKRFENYLVEEEKSKATIEKYVRDVKKLYEYIKNESLTKAALIKYKEMLMESYAPASVNSIIASVNSFSSFCNCPELKIKPVRMQKNVFIDREKELTRDEYERLLRAAKRKNNERLYNVIRTICSTGIRVSELQFVTAEAVDKGKVKINCKGKVRVVILPDKLCVMLKKYMKARRIKKGPVFVTKNGKPLDRSNIWQDMKNLCADARVSRAKVFPHNLRHLFARVYYSVEKDIVRLADILGHSSINTTRIYTMETGEIHKKQLEKLGLLRC